MTAFGFSGISYLFALNRFVMNLFLKTLFHSFLTLFLSWALLILMMMNFEVCLLLAFTIFLFLFVNDDILLRCLLFFGFGYVDSDDEF